ncbi:MAG: hypothetical protein ACQERC_00365 [Bacteroidota bacterium]
MKKLIYRSFILMGLLLMVSCNKSEWKEPTEVSFMVDINKESTMDGDLSFTGGQVLLREIIFDGNRIQGEDVYFEKEHEGGLIVSLSSSANSQLVYEIPQGTYTSIRIDLEAEKSDSDLITVEGNYVNSSGNQLPVIIELPAIEFYDKIAKNSNGETEIDLVAGQPAKATIELDPVFWFENISVNQLENAQTTIISGTESIKINGSVNENLLDLINERVGKGVEIIID